MTCKRSKQCDHADLCQFAKSTEYNLLGGSCFVLKDPQTNEEWRKTCSTEEFAEWMAQYCCDVDTSDVKEILKNEWIKWLKEKHNG